MDDNCPIFKRVSKPDELLANNHPLKCSLYLHADGSDKGSGLTAFGGAIGRLPPVNEAQKQMVG